MRPLSESARWALVVAAGCLLLVAIDIWWLAAHRHGYPLDVDEAGYTTIGLSDYIGLRTGGLHGWWEAVQTQTPNAPLAPAITSLVLLVSPGYLEGFGVLIGFAVLLTLAAYGIGTQLAAPRWGALIALAVATSQGVFIFTREYIFALPTAALLSCAVFALLRSDGLRRRWWAVGCGASLGLMLLARTMSVAFVPGVLIAAMLALLLRGRGDRTNRLINFGLLVLSTAAVAATWYWRNLTPVYEYLTNYGYGSQSQYYGTEHAFISWARLKVVAERMIFSDLLAPLAVLVFVGLVIVGVLAAQRLLRADDRHRELVRLISTDYTSVLLVFAAGYAALMSSRNGGDGFTLPIAMLLPALALAPLRPLGRRAVAPIVAVVGLIAAVNLAASSNLWDGVSKTRTVALPIFGQVPWIDGTPNAVAAIRVQVPGPATRFDHNDLGWQQVNEELADLLHEPIGPEGTQPLVGMAARNRVVNTNSITLAAVAKYHAGIPFVQLEAEPTDTVGGYVHQISESGLGELTALITISPSTDDFPPLLTQSKVEAAARQLDFRQLREFTLPDGRRLRVWIKRAAQAPG